MSIAVVGKEASFEFRWLRWALLRDVLEASQEPVTKDIPNFLSLGDTASSGRRIPASALAREVETITRILAKHSVKDLVMGPQTARVLYMGAELASPRPLTDLELRQIAPIGDAVRLDQYFSSMCSAIADVCKHPFKDGTVELLSA